MSSASRSNPEDLTVHRVKWHRKLSVRLTLLIAVMTITFVQLVPPVTRQASRMLGLKILDPFVVMPEPDAMGPDEMGGVSPDSYCGVPVEAYAATVEIAARQADEPTIAVLKEQLAASLSDWPCFAGMEYCVLSPDLGVLACSLGSQLQRGQLFEPSPQVEMFTQFFPMRDGGQLAAWLCVMPSAAMLRMAPGMAMPGGLDDDDALTSIADSEGLELVVEGNARSFSDGTRILTEKEADSQWSRFYVVSAIVAWGLPLGAALLVGLLVSWTVSRRIVRLSRAAADPTATAIDRFKVSGKDELAQLGVALADSRERIAGLVTKLAENDSQRREWFAQVSHDLRTPLTALSACLERAEPLVDQFDRAAARRDLGQAIAVARQDAERVQLLAADLLDVARLELPGSLVVEDVLPEEFVERAVTGLKPLAEARGVRLDFQGATLVTSHSTAAMVRGDGHRLLRVMENLVRNAIDHASRAVLVSVTLEGGDVRISVVDDGPGFSEVDGEIRVERAGRARADSAGLGLVVVERVLAAHGSKLELENRESSGAIATFRLEAVDASGVHSGLMTA